MHWAIRTGIALLAVVAAIVGLVTAWRSDAAVAALGFSGVMATLAVLGDRVRVLEGKLGNLSLKLEREIQELEETAAQQGEVVTKVAEHDPALARDSLAVLRGIKEQVRDLRNLSGSSQGRNWWQERLLEPRVDLTVTWRLLNESLMIVASMGGAPLNGALTVTLLGSEWVATCTKHFTGVHNAVDLSLYLPGDFEVRGPSGDWEGIFDDLPLEVLASWHDDRGYTVLAVDQVTAAPVNRRS